jgi:hypothetical protein
MAPKEGAGSRRHRSVSEGRTPHGVDGIRRDETRRQATRRGGFRSAQERMSLGNLRFHRPKVERFLPTESLHRAQQQSSLTRSQWLIERRSRRGWRTSGFTYGSVRDSGPGCCQIVGMFGIFDMAGTEKPSVLLTKNGSTITRALAALRVQGGHPDCVYVPQICHS